MSDQGDTREEIMDSEKNHWICKTIYISRPQETQVKTVQDMGS